MKIVIDEKKGTFTITGEISGPVASASGKSLVVASTRGNLKTDTLYQGKPVTIGLNVYIPASAPVAAK